MTILFAVHTAGPIADAEMKPVGLNPRRVRRSRRKRTTSKGMIPSYRSVRDMFKESAKVHVFSLSSRSLQYRVAYRQDNAVEVGQNFELSRGRNPLQARDADEHRDKIL